jgi:hypothetical protein
VKYIFIQDMHLVTKKEKIYYKKGQEIELTEEEALSYISMGALTKVAQNNMTVRLLKEGLDNLGIEYSSNMLKADLQELYDGAQ